MPATDLSPGLACRSNPSNFSNLNLGITPKRRWSLPWPLATAICIWVTATFVFAHYFYRSGEPGSLRLEIRWPENAFRYLPIQEEAQHVLLCTEDRMATWVDSDEARGRYSLCAGLPGGPLLNPRACIDLRTALPPPVQF